MEKKTNGIPDCDMTLFVYRNENGLFLNAASSKTKEVEIRLPDEWFPTCKVGESCRVGVYDLETECCFVKDKIEKVILKDKAKHIPLPLCLPKVTTGKNLNFPGEKYTMVLCNCVLEFETYRENNKNEKCICVTREEEYIGLNSVKLVDFTHADNSPLLTKFRTDILRRIESRCGGEIVGGKK